MLRYLHILFDCVRVLYFRTFTYLVVKFSFSSNIRPDETKNMTLSSKLIFFNVILVPYFLSLKGEILNLKADDPGVLDALDFAMNELNAIRNNLYRLMSTKVEDAIVQVKTQLCLDRYRYIEVI